MAQGKKGMREQTKMVMVRMSDELYKEVQPILEAEQKSFSGLVRELLGMKIDQSKTVVVKNKDLAKIFTEDKELREQIKTLLAKK